MKRFEKEVLLLEITETDLGPLRRAGMFAF